MAKIHLKRMQKVQALKVSTSRPVVDIDETEVAADGESQVKESSGEHLRQKIALANLNELKKVEYQS